ncbi:uncharacterized protein LOC120330254 [Styela clava]
MVPVLPVIVALTTAFLLAVFASIYHTSAKIPLKLTSKRQDEIDHDSSDESSISSSTTDQSPEEDDSVVDILHRSITDANSFQCGESICIGNEKRSNENIHLREDTESSCLEEDTEEGWLEEIESSTSINYSDDESSSTDHFTENTDIRDDEQQLTNDVSKETDQHFDNEREESHAPCELQEKQTSYLFSHEGRSLHIDERVILKPSLKVECRSSEEECGVRIQNEPSYKAFVAHK